MALATEPPIRHDLAFQENDDRPVAVVWLRADAATPIAVTAAALTLRFDLPNDDTWPLDDIGMPVEPARQVHTINGTSSPGDPGGWVVPDGFADGQVLVVVSHGLWATVLEPWTGTWDLVATSVDALQRCLTRGRFVCEGVEP